MTPKLHNDSWMSKWQLNVNWFVGCLTALFESYTSIWHLNFVLYSTFDQKKAFLVFHLILKYLIFYDLPLFSLSSCLIFFEKHKGHLTFLFCSYFSFLISFIFILILLLITMFIVSKILIIIVLKSFYKNMVYLFSFQAHKTLDLGLRYEKSSGK